MASDDQSRDTEPVEPPRGMYPCRLDEKGRLKLPVEFQHFLNLLPEKKLFVTSLDRRIAQIYPMTAWRENEKFFENYRDNPQVAHDVAFNANDLGADAEMDSQGRVLFNTTLRKELDLQNQELHLYAYRGHIKVLTEGIYQERRQRASKASTENVDLLERAGLK
jgi:DNA-binding transcriptional regulator/RsmH inhibitor MraZ